jgi:hypothetical protein
MSKRKPLGPRKEEYKAEVEQQTNDNSFIAFTIICLLATIVVAVAHEIYLWLN